MQFNSVRDNADGKWRIKFEMKMFINLAKRFNVVCNDIQDYNYYELNKQRFLILRAQY